SSRRGNVAAQCYGFRRLDLSVARKFARRSIFRSRISNYSRRKKQCALRRTPTRHGSALAGESASLVAGRLRNFLRWKVREGKPVRPQPELLGIVGRLQVLGAHDMSGTNRFISRHLRNEG